MDDRDRPLARPTDPWTSHAAIPGPEQIGADQLWFLEVLDKARRPLNRYQVSDLTKEGIWKRANELLDFGFIRVVGHNKSPRSNRLCQTLEVTPEGKAFLELKRSRKERI